MVGWTGEIIIATDAGREGEQYPLVARWIVIGKAICTDILVLGCNGHCLSKKSYQKPLKRLWISSVTVII